MKKLAFVLIIALCSCTSDDSSTVPDKLIFQFEDGFEVTNNDLQQLFSSDGNRWSSIQQVGERNLIEINQSIVSDGQHSLRVFAEATEDILSKMGIEKFGFEASENSTVRIEADFYIASEFDLENLLLIDLECCSCWDPTVPDNQCPGIRLMMKGNDFLSIERGKILGSTLTQSNVVFPRNEWVNLVWELKLSPNDDGVNILHINGQEAIHANGMNMPNADIFREDAATVGINFELQEPVLYERLQIGATANPTEFDVEIFIDNFKFSVIEKAEP
ncbi:MAG: hypothetical protein R8G66_34340 [Cytophagales bacterium]|nr:hypothetical protein [Cytophagales bacterium]